jgi:hypothetical protein
VSNFSNEVALIRKRFGTLFEDIHGPASATPVLVIYDNEPNEEPDVEGPYVRLKVDFIDSKIAGLGSPRLFRDVGLTIVMIFVPQGSGEKLLLELVDEVCLIFFAKTVLDGSTMCAFEKPKAQRVGVEGPFYQTNVTTKYYSDFTAP